MKHFIKNRLALYIYLFVLYFYLDLNISFYLELNNQMKILVHPSLQLSSLGTLPPHSLRLITVHNIYSAQYHHTQKTASITITLINMVTKNQGGKDFNYGGKKAII